MQTNKLFCLGLLFLPACLSLRINKRDWDHELISVEVNTSDPSKLSIEMYIERIARGQFALSGVVVWNYDVDNDTMFEGRSLYSPTGSNNYKLLPYGVGKQHMYEFVNGLYKKLLMKPLAHCSTWPQFENAFEPPWEKKTYTYDRCNMGNDETPLPLHMAPGFYKVQMTMYGSVVWNVNMLFKVTSKLT